MGKKTSKKKEKKDAPDNVEKMETKNRKVGNLIIIKK